MKREMKIQKQKLTHLIIFRCYYKFIIRREPSLKIETRAKKNSEICLIILRHYILTLCGFGMNKFDTRFQISYHADWFEIFMLRLNKSGSRRNNYHVAESGASASIYYSLFSVCLSVLGQDNSKRVLLSLKFSIWVTSYGKRQEVYWFSAH